MPAIDLGRNLTHRLLETIGRAIVAGHYDDAAFPTEAELAASYRVSRSVVREATKMLAAKGLVVARTRRGTGVLPAERWSLFDSDVLRWLLERAPTLDLLCRFNELRLGIEPEAAALAAARADDVARRAIAAGLSRMSAADQGEDDALEADIAFHLAILAASGNPFYAQLGGIVETALRTSIRFTNRIEGHRASLAAHAVVHDAIRARDPGRAGAAMRGLIEDVLTVIDRAHGGPTPKRNSIR